MMKIFKQLGIVVITLAMLVGCDTNKRTPKDLSDFVPNHASLTFKINNLSTFQEDIANNPLLAHYKKEAVLSLLHSENTLLPYLNPAGQSVLSIVRRNDSVLDYTFATKADSTVFFLDSIPDKSVETLTYDGITLQRVAINSSSGYTALRDSVFIASSSQTMLQQLLTTKSVHSENFEKAFSVLKNNELTAIVDRPAFTFANKETHLLATNTALDFYLKPNGVTASGVALVGDTISQLLTVFKGQVPQQNDLAAVVPVAAKSAISITVSDASLFLENLARYRADSLPPLALDLFGSVNEIGEVLLEDGGAVILKSIDPNLTQEAIATSLTATTSFRDTQLFAFDRRTVFKQKLSPFITTEEVNIAFQLDRFFVFAENQAVAETVISAYKNNAMLQTSAAFKTAFNDIGSASSFLSYGVLDENSAVHNLLQSSNLDVLPEVGTNAFPLALLQYSFDRDFAHIHFTCLEIGNEAVRTTGVVTELFSKTLETELLGTPQFFSNHRTGTKNLVVQDISNQLHLLTNSGKTLWTRNLNAPILGTIHEVDLLRNGRKQLAFATDKKLYVVDRNGKDVGPFPLTFNDRITQPLAVFDYDNNRKYRFAIIQGREIVLYDNKGKMVSGFTFRKATSPIVLPAQHIRMGNKDYVLVAEENGTLNILSRTGVVRVPVSATFNFSENPIEREGSNFVVITRDKEKKSIGTDGKVQTQKLDVSNTYHFATLGTTKVTMDDNLLRINGKLVELPFGVYTTPRIYQANRKTYITVTETQEKKVYLFTKNGTLIQNFPVYGNSPAAITNEKGKTLVVVGTDNKEVITYSF